MNNYSLEVPALLTKLESELKHLIQSRQIDNPVMIGLYSGGVWVAKQLHQRLAIKEPLGIMDISFYRDDFSQGSVHSKVKPSQLPNTMAGRDIILIDDVFYTGRTARAALNEVFDYGRPNQVILAVLIERVGRQVPMQPDCVGHTIKLVDRERVKLMGPEPLTIRIQPFDNELDVV